MNADSLATWFPQAAATFGRDTGVALDLMLEHEAHTIDRLRSGEVLAAVTADPEPVQGCKTVLLGALRYVACASPGFMARHFTTGVDAETLMRAPHLRFDRRDTLQARWAREVYGIDVGAPTGWIQSTHGFLDLALAGLGWGLHPLALAESHIATGRLVELRPASRIDVKLYWTVSRLHSNVLRKMTEAVRAAVTGTLVG